MNNTSLIKYKYPIIGASLLLVLAGYLVWYFSDKQVIIRLVHGLSWDIRKEGQEGLVDSSLKMRNIKSVLAETITLNIPERGSFTEILGSDLAILYLRHYRDHLDLLQPSLDDILVTLPGKTEARVQAKVQLQRQERQGAVQEVAALVELHLTKEEGQWLIHKAVIPEILF